MMLPEKETPYGEILTHIETLKAEKEDLAGFLDQYYNIISWQKEIRDSFSPALDKIDVPQGLKRTLKGKPFLKPEDIQIDRDLFDTMLMKVVKEAALSKGEEPAGLPPAADDPVLMHDLLHGILHKDSELLSSIAERYEVAVGVFIFAAHQSVIPFIEYYAENLKGNIDQGSWLRGSCPVCGGEPLMGKLTSDGGQRWMMCGLCRTEWLYKRVECPFCGNSEQDTLQYFYNEDDKQSRVDVCDKCKGYVKVLDARELIDEPILVIEDALSIHLDLAARQEGYGRAGAELFGI